MEELSIKIKKDVDLSNSMVIIGFPTVGLIGSIACNYISKKLNLEQIGSIHSKYFLPSVIIRDSKPIPPVRIYYTDDEFIKENENFDHLLAIVSDLPIPQPAIYPMINEMLKWSDDGNVSLFLGLEGLKSKDKKEDQVDVYGVGSTKKMVDTLNKYDIEKTKEGMIAGFNGGLMLAETNRNEDMLCLLTEAHSLFPDSRAAGRLLEKVDEMLPEVDIDLEPLYDEAEKIEKSIRKFMEQSKQSAPQMQQVSKPPMYG